MTEKMIVIAALALTPVAILAALRPLFRAKKSLGERLQKFRIKKDAAVFLLPPASVALILLCLIRDFTSLTAFGICGCGVLGFYLSVKEICFRFSAGVYERGFLAGSDYMLFADIGSTEITSENVLAVTTKNREQKFFHVRDEIREAILAAIQNN